MKPYPLVDDLLRPILRVAMPRAGRLYAPGGTVHVVARCNNREFCFTTAGTSRCCWAICGRWSGTKSAYMPTP